MLASAVKDVLSVVAAFTVCGLLALLAYRLEPHWVSKDGTRFLTVARYVNQWGLPFGRKFEVRVAIDHDSESLLVSRRSLRRTLKGVWVIESKLADPPRGKVVFVLKDVTGVDEIGNLWLTIPTKSKALPRLEAIVGDDPAA
ncbi:hypothetical protein BH24ACT5_BH24ACT5_14470 [soil metagenome]